MKLPLDIETHDKKLAFDIASVGNSLVPGTVIEVPGGGKLEYRGTYERKAFGIPDVLKFIVDASTTIDLGLFSAWLYNKAKDKPVEKIVIRRTEVTEITKESIRKVLEEEITKIE